MGILIRVPKVVNVSNAMIPGSKYLKVTYEIRPDAIFEVVYEMTNFVACNRKSESMILDLGNMESRT